MVTDEVSQEDLCTFIFMYFGCYGFVDLLILTLSKNSALQGANEALIVKWKHLLDHLWVTEALNRPQKHPKMMLYGKLFRPYS